MFRRLVQSPFQATQPVGGRRVTRVLFRLDRGGRGLDGVRHKHHPDHHTGFISAIVLVINAAKRAEILTLSPASQLAAPLAQLMAIGLVVGILVATPAIRGRLGSFGVVLYVASLVALVGVEFVNSAALATAARRSCRPTGPGVSTVDWCAGRLSLG